MDNTNYEIEFGQNFGILNILIKIFFTLLYPSKLLKNVVVLKCYELKIIFNLYSEKKKIEAEIRKEGEKRRERERKDKKRNINRKKEVKQR